MGYSSNVKEVECWNLTIEILHTRKALLIFREGRTKGVKREGERWNLHSDVPRIGSNVEESPVGVKSHTGRPQGETMIAMLLG